MRLELGQRSSLSYLGQRERRKIQQSGCDLPHLCLIRLPFLHCHLDWTALIIHRRRLHRCHRPVVGVTAWLRTHTPPRGTAWLQVNGILLADAASACTHGLQQVGLVLRRRNEELL